MAQFGQLVLERVLLFLASFLLQLLEETVLIGKFTPAEMLLQPSSDSCLTFDLRLGSCPEVHCQL